MKKSSLECDLKMMRKNLFGKVAWDIALERRDIQESWLIFKNHFLNFQVCSIPTKKKSSNGGKRSARWTRRSWWNLGINPKWTENRSRDETTQERCRTTVYIGWGLFLVISALSWLWDWMLRSWSVPSVLELRFGKPKTIWAWTSL